MLKFALRGWMCWEVLTVPFMAKMKIIRNSEKYLAPLFSANMKMKQPVSTIGTG
jgi:hypothetical protein